MSESKSLYYTLSPILQKMGNQWEYESRREKPDEDKMVFLFNHAVTLVTDAHKEGFLSDYELKLFTEYIGDTFC